MPAASPMPPPPAPPAGVTIVPPATPPKPPPPPTREIKLGAPKETGPAATPPKPGSARERMSQALRAKAGVTETATPPPVAEPISEPATPPGEPTAPAPSPEAPGAPAEPAAPAAPAATPPKGEKVNPWKLVDNYKARVATLEKQISDSGAASPDKVKEYLGQIETLTKRNTDLENEIRFVNYEKSEEFQTKFHAPYEAAWQRAIAELSEITITDPSTNAPRQATPQDLWDILSVPLTRARELANQYFGDFADDVMGYRKEIKGLLDARQRALDEAKQKGSERDKTRGEIIKKHATEVSQFIKENWTKAVDDLSKHETYGKYFTPVDGDQDGNQRLAKGFELVDRAFNESPADPRLTPEQRAGVVKRHAAVRARAAAFGRLVSMVNAREARIAELETELGQYRTSEPKTGGAPVNPSAPAAPASAHDRIFGELRKRAH